ncbi:hypothetical protein D3C80_2187570 [compost metagenome]
MLTIEVFHGAGEKPCGAARRITDHVRRLRGDQFDHRIDDVTRCTELTVDAGGGELA